MVTMPGPTRRSRDIMRHSLLSRLKKALLGLRGALLLLLDTFTLLVVKGQRRGGRQKVLIVRLDRIGDFLLWLPTTSAWRFLYPADQYELTLLANPSWAETAEGLHCFDHVQTLDVHRFVWSLPYRYRFMKWVRQTGFAKVVQARYSRELFAEDAVTRVSGAGERFGFARHADAGTHIQKRISDRWYTQLFDDGGPDSMELQRNAILMRSLGLTGFRSEVPTLPVTEALPAELQGMNYYVLFPGASWGGKRWPVEKFQRLAQRIYAACGWTGVLCGASDEREIGVRLLADTTSPLLDWIGKTSLPQLVTVIAGAQMLIGNDTSGIHMAAAVGTPSVCILGGGHYGRFLPYVTENPAAKPLPLPVIKPMACFGCDWHCIYERHDDKPVPCVRDVSVESVWAAIDNLGLPALHPPIHADVI